MAYAKPTPTEFKARFPEFAGVDDERVSMIVDEVATLNVDETWIESDYAPAIMFMTAHTLYVEGALADEDEAAPGMVSGPISSVRVGDTQVGFGASGSSAGGARTAFMAELERTHYGRRFLGLMRRNFPAIITV